MHLGIFGPFASLVYLHLWSICLFGTLIKLQPSLCKMGGKLNQVVAQLEASWCQVVTNWEASWGHVGGNWDSQDGTKLGQVEAKLINFGTNLGPSWALLGQVGPCWGHVGTRLAQVGAKLDQVEAKLG